ncbi:hypothetical protein AMTRI_Chr11g98550 [Amborella trichopoda]
MALTDVVIVTDGEHSDLATSAYFYQHSFSNLVLKGEVYSISLGKKRSYDCLNVYFSNIFPFYFTWFIVEAWPSGLATSTCLNHLSFSNQAGL